jgi:hypothetical protein
LKSMLQAIFEANDTNGDKRLDVYEFNCLMLRIASAVSN